MGSHNIVHTLPPSTRIFNEASESNDLMYSNLDHADKKTLNNEDCIKKIMESEAQGSQDANNNVQESEESKNYCWKTEERNGIRYNTLNYTNKKSVIRNESEESKNTNSKDNDSDNSSKSCCSVIFDNCCILFLILVIFILVISLTFALVRCFFLEEQIRELRLFIKNSSKVSENQSFMVTQSSNDKSATFFPD